jgi:hypothetical protein
MMDDHPRRPFSGGRHDVELGVAGARQRVVDLGGSRPVTGEQLGSSPGIHPGHRSPKRFVVAGHMRDACSMSARGELWTCPKCGRRFVGRNMWHACGDYSVEGFLDGKGERARELFEGFERLIAACGPYEVAPAKTRVAFMGRVRFAGVSAVSDRGMTIAFGLPRRLRHPRIRKIEEYGGGWYGHWMRITDTKELDDELLGWLRESYDQMGMQERLAGR